MSHHLVNTVNEKGDPMSFVPSRKNVQRFVKRLEKKGIVPHSDPYFCIHEKIEFVCSCNSSHRFFWDLQDIVDRLARSRRRTTTTMCPDCAKLEHLRDHCSRLGLFPEQIGSIDCSLRMPCGHSISMEHSTLLSYKTTPLCGQCRDQEQVMQSIRFCLKQLDIVKNQGLPFQEEDVSVVLEQVVDNLSTVFQMDCKRPFQYHTECRDLLIPMTCREHHENTTTLRGILSLMMCTIQKKLMSPCPDCHNVMMQNTTP